MNPNQAGQQQCKATPAPTLSSLVANAEQAVALVAAKVRQFANDLPRAANEIIRLVVPADALCCIDTSVDVRVMGRDGFNALDFMRLDAGARLGQFIASKQEFTSRREDPMTYERAASYDYRDRYLEHFRTEVVVLSRAQLRKAIERAVEIGRASA